MFVFTVLKHLYATERWKVRVGRDNIGGCSSRTVYYEVRPLKLEHLWRL